MLSEQEFNALRDKVLAGAPEGLDETGFHRYAGPAMAQAVGEAESATPTPQGSAAWRFLSNAASTLNPVAAVKGLASAAWHPVDTYQGLVDASADQFGKAKEAYDQGRYSEAIGHGAAGVLPGIGPAAADTGEQMAAGDVAGGLGRGLALAAGPTLTGNVLPRAVARIPAMRAPVGRALDATGRGLEAVAASPMVRNAGGLGAGYQALQGDWLGAAGAVAGPPIAAASGRGLRALGRVVKGDAVPLVERAATAPIGPGQQALNRLVAEREASVRRGYGQPPPQGPPHVPSNLPPASQPVHVPSNVPTATPQSVRVPVSQDPIGVPPPLTQAEAVRDLVRQKLAPQAPVFDEAGASLLGDVGYVGESSALDLGAGRPPLQMPLTGKALLEKVSALEEARSVPKGRTPAPIEADLPAAWRELPTDADVSTAVTARNTTGRWKRPPVEPPPVIADLPRAASSGGAFNDAMAAAVHAKVRQRVKKGR
jgi:hypothetical protein